MSKIPRYGITTRKQDRRMDRVPPEDIRRPLSALAKSIARR